MSANKTLFEELVAVLQYRRPALYTDGRAKKLTARLRHFSGKELALAARVIADNPYMMGDNPGGVRYATVDYLLRSDEVVEKWLEMAEGDSAEIDLSGLKF